MGRNDATPLQGPDVTSGGPPPERAPSRRWSPAAKITTVAATLVVLLGLMVFTASREAPPSRLTPPALQRASVPPRPAWTSDEEKYIRALWPIHGDVERGTMRASLGQILYKTQDLKRDDLRRRMEQALAVYRRAEDQLRFLLPPASLRREHDEYMSAVQLFRESALGALKMFEDGREAHLIAAYPKSQEGRDKVRDAGGEVGATEYAAT